MAEAKISNNKMAMSRALGAAFLNHQVEQLEKTVHGTASGNWRDRRGPVSIAQPVRRGPSSPGVKVAPRKKGGESQVAQTKVVEAVPAARRAAVEENGKDADVVVVDASVLVHALYKVKKWCREGRDEVIIIPLEALNTLDFLKKGSSTLAQRARAASRILEAQVGTNSRIRVQRDDAFVPWDKTAFKDGTDAKGCPEWVRRILCCAQWEVDHVQEELKVPVKNPKVILAVLSNPPNVSPQVATIRLSETEAPLTPVPLPAPNLNHTKHEPRSSGTLVSLWASKAGLELLPVDPTLPGIRDEEERPKRVHVPNGRGRKGSGGPDHSNKTAMVERPPAVMAMMEMVSQPTKTVRLLARGEKLEPDS
ncbi:hypothetical protein D9611_009665 [Ephemerocybe angulata]|uniref:PIN domain-containing protein n=1 Tax=Ephemerocybe angulata TaxID=980116 RepID=A0A8H5C5Z3_9AGAR|nr:hypothetical protein D9611_009665 [Tulosesus angulatus]